MKVDIGGSRVDPAARSVDERIHRRKDLIDLDDKTWIKNLIVLIGALFFS